MIEKRHLFLQVSIIPVSSLMSSQITPHLRNKFIIVSFPKADAISKYGVLIFITFPRSGQWCLINIQL